MKAILRRLERVSMLAATADQPKDFHENLDQMNAEFMTGRERRLFALLVSVIELSIDRTWDDLRTCFEPKTEQDFSALTYEEYLQTDHWKLLRQQKLIQADYRCQVCYGAKRLNVHHRTYERRGHEDLSDLTVLCEECHARFHDKLPQDAAQGANA